jgi:hypothetical protein
METKVCSSCGLEKPVSEFRKASSTKDGLTYSCKQCHTKYQRSLKGFLHKLYNTQKKNSKARGHKPPAYTFDELKNWVIKQPNFKYLWKQWKNSGHNIDLIPSIDRLDDGKGYSFDNIRLVTWRENSLKESMKRRKRVNQYSLEGKYIKTWDSMTDVAKNVNTFSSSIILACKGVYSSSRGFLWRYLSDEFPEGKDIIPEKKQKQRRVKVNLPNGEVKLFNSLTECKTYFGCSLNTITNKLRGTKSRVEALKDVTLSYVN